MTPAGGLSKRLSSGFSLMELMVSIAIIGILLAIALPNYSAYIRDAKRTKAASCLMEHAQYMAQFRAAHMRFDQKVDGSAVTLPSLACAQDNELAGLYVFDFAEDEPTTSTFIVWATPTDSDAECGTLSIDHKGVRGVTGSGAVSDCW